MEKRPLYTVTKSAIKFNGTATKKPLANPPFVIKKATSSSKQQQAQEKEP
jgi:hypothetical protein